MYVVGSGRNQTWQHVYTAVTRGRHQVIVVARKSMLSWAIEQPPIARCTGLRDKLTHVISLPSDSVICSTDLNSCFCLLSFILKLNAIDFRARNFLFCHDLCSLVLVLDSAIWYDVIITTFSVFNWPIF